MGFNRRNNSRFKKENKMNEEVDNESGSGSPVTDESESLLPIDEHEEVVSENGKKVLRRGIFLLPNLMTLGALFSGFYAIVAAMAGEFNEAGWAVFLSGVFDALDGRIARLTNTQSAFGAQFDSLSDMVSFGVAPAFISFSWAFPDIGRLGWAASFIYMSCAAMRLARFNVQLESVDKRYFVGLQSPMAAALVCFIPWVSFRHGVEVTAFVAYGMVVITILAGMLMISNYKYHSFKEVYVKGTVPYLAFGAVIILLVVIAQEPPEVLLTLCIIYVASGPLGVLWRRIKNKQPSEKGST